MFFSVIIPTFNRPEKLKRAINSVLAQTFKDFEIIVVNDGGKDVSDIIKSFSSPIIRYFSHNKNFGIAKARNTGIANSNGNYIALLDDDDVYFPEHLSVLQHSILQGNKVVYTDAQRATYLIADNKQILQSRTLPYSIDYDRNKLLIANISPTNTFAFEKNLAVKIGLFNETFPVLEDWEFFLRLSSVTPFHHIAKVTVCVEWLLNSNNLTSARKDDFKKYRSLIYNHYREELDNIPNRDKIIEEFNAIWAKDGHILHPLVSIIVLTHNAKEYSEMFFLSLVNSCHTPFELIVVDNASTDGTAEMLSKMQKQNPEQTKVIFNSENFGFPKGVNQAIKSASGNYILLANNDIIVTAGWLDRMVEIAESNPKFGIIGPVSNEVSGAQKLKEIKYLTLDEMHNLAEKIAKDKAGKFFEFPRVTFLCTLIKKELIAKIGGLDERFSPGNFEDDDYCMRALIAGYKSVIAEDVFIHHFGSKSFTAEGQQKYLNRLETNRQIYIKKWGADPNEIILQGKQIIPRNTFIPLHKDPIIENFERIKLLIQDSEPEIALNICKETLLAFTEEIQHGAISKKDFEELKVLLEEILK